MIPYEELDRALARWKARSQAGVVEPQRPESAVVDVDSNATPAPPARPDAFGSPDRTAEFEVGEIESYDDQS